MNIGLSGNWIILIGTGITAFGILLTAYGGFKAGKEDRQASAKDTAEIIQNVQEGTEKSREIAETTDETIAVVRGDDAYARVMVDLSRSSGEVLRLNVHHVGSNRTAIDVRIQFINGFGGHVLVLADDGSIVPFQVAGMAAETPRLPKDAIYPMNHVLVPTIPPAYYPIYIRASSRDYIQQLYVQQVDGEWKQSSRLFDVQTREQINSFGLRYVSQDFEWPDVRGLLGAIEHQDEVKAALDKLDTRLGD